MATKTGADVLKLIKDNDVKYVDFRFTDPRGKWQHVTFDVSLVDEDIFAEGTMFDGSSIAGWKAINQSDMILMPDPQTACMDPFFSASNMSSVCDTVYVGPEAEFFVFDDVRFAADPYNTGFKLDSTELPTNGDTEYEGGNLGHRVQTKG